MSACAMPSPRALESHELGQLDTAALDLRGCDRLEISVMLYEHESAGMRFESWPGVVQTQIEKHLADWLVRHGERAARAVTTTVAGRCCVLVLHHAKKG